MSSGILLVIVIVIGIVIGIVTGSNVSTPTITGIGFSGLSDSDGGEGNSFLVCCLELDPNRNRKSLNPDFVHQRRLSDSFVAERAERLDKRGSSPHKPSSLQTIIGLYFACLRPFASGSCPQEMTTK